MTYAIRGYVICAHHSFTEQAADAKSYLHDPDYCRDGEGQDSLLPNDGKEALVEVSERLPFPDVEESDPE